jgi:hypothetical protein
MSSYVYTGTGSSQISAAIATDKIRIATTTSAIAFVTGDATAVANITACEIVPAGMIRNSIIVGQGNYVAFINVAGTAGAFSITELGAPHAITGTE